MRYENISEDDDDFGPAIPNDLVASKRLDGSAGGRQGPSIPNMDELRARREQDQEDAESAKERYINGVRQGRRLDRKVQKERLDEIVPRAEAGTRERQLEKKREKADSNRTFAASKDGNDLELREADVMGDEDSLGQLKRMQKEQERKKNDREIRREEALRARQAERNEKLKGMREKEAKTMEMLKEIAKSRFGP